MSSGGLTIIIGDCSFGSSFGKGYTAHKSIPVVFKLTGVISLGGSQMGDSSFGWTTSGALAVLSAGLWRHLR